MPSKKFPEELLRPKEGNPEGEFKDNAPVVYPSIASFVIDVVDPAYIRPPVVKPENVGAPPVVHDMTPPVVEVKERPDEAGKAAGKVYDPAVVAATLRVVVPAVEPTNCKEPLFPVALPLAKTPYALTPEVLVAVKLT